MIGGGANPRASELGSIVVAATMKSLSGGRAAVAAVGLACAVGFIAAAPGAAPAKWTSSLSLAAAFGLAFSPRRPRKAAESGRDDAMLSLAGDFVARQRIDGRVTAIDGEGWADWAADGAELVGYGLIDRLHEDDRGGFLAQLAAVAEDGRARTTMVRLRKDTADGFQLIEATSGRSSNAGGLVTAFRRSRALVELEEAREEARI